MQNTSPSCPACRSHSTEHVAEFELDDQFRKYAQGRDDVRRELAAHSGLDCTEYSQHECAACGLRFAVPMLAPSGAWYSYAYDALDFHSTDRWEFSHVLETLHAGDRIGEIGCGIGIFLAGARRRGIPAEGVDFSPGSIAECVRKGLSARSIHLDLDNFVSTPDRSAITSFHVLEHLAEPGRLFSLAARWAQPEAALWIAVPSERCLSRLTDRHDPFDEPPHHLTQWTCEALRVLGAAHGWHLEELVHERMGLRQRLWTLCTSSRVYGWITAGGRPSTWTDRLLRYMLYPWILAFRWNTVMKLSGPSMLARFRRAHDLV